MKLAPVAAAWVLGLLLGLQLDVGVPALASFGLATLLLAILLKVRGFQVWPPLLVMVLLIGILRVEAPGEPAAFRFFESPDPVTVRGTVSNDPELERSTVEFTLSVESLDKGDGWEVSQGKLLVFARPSEELVRARKEPYFRYGDVLDLTGTLNSPPELRDFDYGAYLEQQGIHAILNSLQVQLVAEGQGNFVFENIYSVRHRLADGIDKALPEPQAALAQALLLGLRGGLPDDVTDDFRSTGTGHLLAISGLHVGVVLIAAMGAGVWLLGRRRQVYLLLPLATIWLYALVSGLSPSAERAAIMGSAYLLALATGRPKVLLPALALAAAVMAGFNPHALMDVSFQLSFTALAGIALLTPYMSPFWGYRVGVSPGKGTWQKAALGYLAFALLISSAVTVATLPLIAFNFHRIPTVGIPATILLLPAMPLLLISSGIAGVAGVASPMAGQVLGWFAWVLLEYTIRLVNLFSQIPGSTISVPRFSGVLLWVYYGVIAYLLLAPRTLYLLLSVIRNVASAGKGCLNEPPGTTTHGQLTVAGLLVATITLAVLAGLLWHQVLVGSDGRLHVYFMDVGQGDSILIVTPGGKQVLVDGGPGVLDSAQAVGSKLKFWDRDLDLVVLTHPDEDHFRGLLEIAERYNVDAVLEGGGGAARNPLYFGWEAALTEKNIDRIQAYRGQIITLDKATRLEVLNPPTTPIVGGSSTSNNHSVVLKLVYGQANFLLTADVEVEGELSMLQDGLSLKSLVLQVPHHGSKSSTSQTFLSAVDPVAAVISVGADNPYGHPHDDTLERLEAAPGTSMTFTTAEQGDIEFISDGIKLWVKTSR